MFPNGTTAFSPSLPLLCQQQALQMGFKCNFCAPNLFYPCIFLIFHRWKTLELWWNMVFVFRVTLQMACRQAGGAAVLWNVHIMIQCIKTFHGDLALCKRIDLPARACWKSQVATHLGYCTIKHKNRIFLAHSTITIIWELEVGLLTRLGSGAWSDNSWVLLYNRGLWFNLISI